jgi:hypothetical protein
MTDVATTTLVTRPELDSAPDEVDIKFLQVINERMARQTGREAFLPEKEKIARQACTRWPKLRANRRLSSFLFLLVLSTP